MHRILSTDNVDKLLIKPIVSNINTFFYKLAKYLAKLLSPSSLSQYTVNGTKILIKQMKHEKIPTGYQMITFDLKSLFTILQRVYDRNEITTQIPKKVIKELLLCTK